MKMNIHIFLLVTIFLSVGENPLYSQNDSGKQYQVKAAFLYRFIDYVDWNNDSRSRTFNIAIMGKSSITTLLNGIATGKKAKNKPKEITEYDDLNKIGFCNVLFVPKNSKTSIESIISKFSGKPVLVVTEEDGYGKKGAHMNFVIVNDKLKFEVNLKAINKSNMNISSFLLQHAILVE
jgi:hypothetical protein